MKKTTKPMWSKKTLIPWLISNGYILNDTKVDYEAYGRKVKAFVRVEDLATRFKLERALQVNGQKVDADYWPGHPVVDVRVTYFKAWQWDK